jgi:hypothetical protein
MRTAVDVFFRTLASTHGSLSTVIVLSGGDGDGAIGIKRIWPNHTELSVILRTPFKCRGKFSVYLLPVLSLNHLKELLVATAEC